MFDARKYFDENWHNYDKWYEFHKNEYNEEIEFLKSILPSGKGIEIGIGTGRFSLPLKIEYGLDYSLNMLKIAKSRGIEVILGDAYRTPFMDKSFDFSLFMVTLCFLEKPVDALFEAKRISRKVVSVILDKNSEYVSDLMKNPKGFYKFANFLSLDDLLSIYEKAGLGIETIKVEDHKTNESKIYTLIGVSSI